MQLLSSADTNAVIRLSVCGNRILCLHKSDQSIMQTHAPTQTSHYVLLKMPLSCQTHNTACFLFHIATCSWLNLRIQLPSALMAFFALFAFLYCHNLCKVL